MGQPRVYDELTDIDTYTYTHATIKAKQRITYTTFSKMVDQEWYASVFLEEYLFKHRTKDRYASPGDIRQIEWREDEK